MLLSSVAPRLAAAEGRPGPWRAKVADFGLSAPDLTEAEEGEGAGGALGDLGAGGVEEAQDPDERRPGGRRERGGDAPRRGEARPVEVDVVHPLGPVADDGVGAVGIAGEQGAERQVDPCALAQVRQQCLHVFLPSRQALRAEIVAGGAG